MTGEIGGSEVLLFDFRYTIGHGKHQQVHAQTVVLLPGGAAELPDFQLAPATFMDKLGKLFGSKTIDFEDHPEFSQRYRLTGVESEAVRSAFTPVVRSALLQQQGWSVEACDDDLLVYRHGKRRKPPDCPELIAEALTIRNCFTPPDADEVSQADLVS